MGAPNHLLPDWCRNRSLNRVIFKFKLGKSVGAIHKALQYFFFFAASAIF